MESMLTVSIVALGFIFAFINGFHDGGNVVATIVSSRSISPRKALFFACMAEFFGPLSLGTAVAVTVGKDIIDLTCFAPSTGLMASTVLMSALVSAIIWDLVTWWVGMPSSSSHALVGGLVGGGIAAFGPDIVKWSALFYKVILVLFVSPIIGISAGSVIFAAGLLGGPVSTTQIVGSTIIGFFRIEDEISLVSWCHKWRRRWKA